MPDDDVHAASLSFATAPDGTRIGYRTTGAGEAILLVSGQSLDHRMWDPLVPMLAADHRVIVYDHRGTGASDKPTAPPYSTELFADDAVAVLDAVGVERAHVFGFSMGGRIGQWIGIRHPNRIGALVLGATTGGHSRGIRRQASITALLQSGNVAALDDLFYTPAHLASGAPVLAVSDMPLFAKRLHFMASDNHETWALLPTIAAPTLVIHGSDDQVTPTDNARLLASTIPNASIAIIPGARHGFVADFREETYRLVTDFLRAHPLPEART